MYATDYFERMILNTLRGQAATAPATLYMALYLSNPGETGAEGTEVSYSGYLRQQVQFTAPAPMNGGVGVETAQEITFPQSGVNLGTITHVGILDSPTAGNMLLYAEFTQGLVVEANEAPVIVAGEAQWWLTNDLTTSFRTKILNLLRGQSLPGFIPHFAMYNGNPEDGGTELGRDGGGYARIPLEFSAPEDAGTGQTRIANSAAVSTARSTTPWGTWAYVVIMDAAMQGNPVYAQARTPKEMRAGMMTVIPAGSLQLAIN